MSYSLFIITGFFKAVLTTSWMASVLVGLILLVKVVLKDKLKARWHYLIWLLLIARLVLPWTPESSFSIFNLFLYGNHDLAAIYQEQQTSIPNTSTTAASSISSSGTEKSISPDAMPMTEKIIPAGISQWFLIVSVGWVLTVLVFALHTIKVNKAFSSMIRKQARLAESDILSIFDKCKEEMSIRRNIPLFVSEQVTGPTLFGFWRPRLIMPELSVASLNHDQLQYIFLHELAHIKRKDIALNWLMQVMLIVHWFNPILWYAFSRMREDQEVACDALALTHIPPKESTEYGQTIIRLLEGLSGRPTIHVPGTAGLSGSKKQLKRRITMIKLFNQNSNKWSILGLAVLILLGSIALTNGKSTALSASTTTHTITDQELAQLVTAAHNRYWLLNSGGSGGVPEQDPPIGQKWEYRWMGADVDTKPEYIAFLEEIYTPGQAADYWNKMTETGSILEVNGKLVQPNADGGSLLNWDKSSAKLVKNSNDQKTFRFTVPVGEDQGVVEREVKLRYIDGKGWRFDEAVAFVR